MYFHLAVVPNDFSVSTWLRGSQNHQIWPPAALLSSSLRKLVKDFFHLRPQFLKPLPVFTLLDLSSALGPINHRHLETMCAHACVETKGFGIKRSGVNHSLTLFNSKTLGRLPKKSEPLYPHLHKRNDNPYFIRVVVKTKLAACEVFIKVHNLREMTIDWCSHFTLLSPLLAPEY